MSGTMKIYLRSFSGNIFLERAMPGFDGSRREFTWQEHEEYLRQVWYSTGIGHGWAPGYPCHRNRVTG